jgi:hypothetical protein
MAPEIWLTRPSVGGKNAYRRRQVKFTMGQLNAVAMEWPDGWKRLAEVTPIERPIEWSVK